MDDELIADARGALKDLAAFVEVSTCPLYEFVLLSPLGNDVIRRNLDTLEKLVEAAARLQLQARQVELLKEAHTREIERIYREEVEPLRRQAGKAVILQGEVDLLNRTLERARGV